MLDRIKDYFLNRKTTQALANTNRQVRLVELAEVKSVGVLFDASVEADYNRAAHLIRHFKSQKKEVRSIGFVNMPALPHYVDNTLSFDYIKSKDVNWFNLPSERLTTDFVEMPFDLLIDLNFEYNPSLQYLSKISMAHCKIGLNQGAENSHFDFMLEGIAPNNLSLFLKELLHYLEIIKTH